MTQLIDYVHSQWLQGPVFSTKDISVFEQLIRTNNDVEGWHYRLNHRGQKYNLEFELNMLCVYIM